MLQNKYKVYILIDPRSNIKKNKRVKYVGQTKQTLNKRLYQHIIKCKSPSQKQCYVNKWINKLLSQGVQPKIVEVACFTTREDADAKEQELISELTKQGFKLCNLTLGGDGHFKMTETVRKKMSASHKGKKNHFHGKQHSKKTKQKISGSKKGATLSEEHKRKISLSMLGKKNHFYGKQHSKKTKQKIAKAHAKTYHFLNPNNQVVEIANLAKFCRENDLNVAAMNDLYYGVRYRKSYKGWKRVNSDLFNT